MIDTFKKAIKRISFTDQLLLILVIFTCTFFVYRDFEIHMSLGYAVLVIVLGIHILRRIFEHKKLQITCMEGIFLGIVLVIWISYLRPDAREDEDTLSYVIAMTICAFSVLIAQPDMLEIKRSLRIMRIVAFLLSAYIVFFVLFEDVFWTTIYPYLSETAAEYLDYYVPRGYSITVGGVTYTDYILFLGVACSAGLFLSQKPDQKIRYRYLLEMVYFACVILLTGRRGEFLGAILTCALLFIMTGDGKHRIIRAAVLLGCALACAGLLILALPLLKQVDVLHRYAMTIEQLINGEDISSGRTQLYQWAWDAFLQKPVFGIGWDRFAECITPEFHAIHGWEVEDVHCIYLQFLCEIGLVGATLIIFPMAYLYIQTAMQLIRLRKAERNLENGNIIVASNGTSFVLQSFLLIMGIYDPCFQKIVFWCFYGIAIILSSYALKLDGYAFDDRISKWIKSVYNKELMIVKKVGKEKNQINNE